GRRGRPRHVGEAARGGAAEDQGARDRPDRHLQAPAAEGLVLRGRLRALLAAGRARGHGDLLVEALFAVGEEAQYHPELPRSTHDDKLAGGRPQACHTKTRTSWSSKTPRPCGS